MIVVSLHGLLVGDLLELLAWFVGVVFGVLFGLLW